MDSRVIFGRRERGDSRGLYSFYKGYGGTNRKELGYAYVAVLGDPAYYSRFGYGPAADLGIKAPPSFPTDYFMAIQLDGSARSLDGSIIYDAAFGIS